MQRCSPSFPPDATSRDVLMLGWMNAEEPCDDPGQMTQFTLLGRDMMRCEFVIHMRGAAIKEADLYVLNA